MPHPPNHPANTAPHRQPHQPPNQWALPAPLMQVLERHHGRVSDLDWAPDGSTLLSCSQDGLACLWRPDTGALVRAFRNSTGPLCCCRFHPANPNLLLLGTAAGELLALNASTGRWAGWWVSGEWMCGHASVPVNGAADTGKRLLYCPTPLGVGILRPACACRAASQTPSAPSGPQKASPTTLRSAALCLTPVLPCPSLPPSPSLASPRRPPGGQS